MQQWLIHLAGSHTYLIYALIVALACAEGPILSMIFGVLLRLGYFSFIPVYAALMLGDLIGDVIWYFIGYRYGHAFIARFGKYWNISEEGVEKVTKLFHKHKHSILFISKITNGFGFALVTLMTAGMIKIPFWRYMTINLVGQFAWSGILLGVGYFFGEAYTEVNDWFGRISLGILFLIVIFALNGYKKYLKARAEKMTV